jgi:phosphatidylglycerophosphate synthase
VTAAAAGTTLALAPLSGTGVRAAAFLVAAVFVQLRLACNMLDGLLAIEGGLASPTGELWNELPDRIADPLILVGAGLAVRELPWGPSLGWTCSILALLTSCVRLLGGSLGLRQSFAGPMAKQHRMFAVTLGCVGAAIESLARRPPRILWLALAVVAVGSAITAARRVRAIVRELRG